jgi:hypothetical protein
MVPSGACAFAAPKFMLHWRPAELNRQRPAIAVGGAIGCGVAALGPAAGVLVPVKLQPAQRPSASSATVSADTRDAGRISLMP